jgi:hypothetical protein
MALMLDLAGWLLDNPERATMADAPETATLSMAVSVAEADTVTR